MASVKGQHLSSLPICDAGEDGPCKCREAMEAAAEEFQAQVRIWTGKTKQVILMRIMELEDVGAEAGTTEEDFLS